MNERLSLDFIQQCNIMTSNRINLAHQHHGLLCNNSNQPDNARMIETHHDPGLSQEFLHHIENMKHTQKSAWEQGGRITSKHRYKHTTHFGNFMCSRRRQQAYQNSVRGDLCPGVLAMKFQLGGIGDATEKCQVHTRGTQFIAAELAWPAKSCSLLIPAGTLNW